MAEPDPGASAPQRPCSTDDIPSVTSSQCYINCLSAEILDSIFIILKEQGFKHITPCLAVSKQWHRHGQRLLWSSLALTELSYDRFIHAVVFGGSSYRALLNLTVTLQNAYEMRCRCTHRGDWGKQDRPCLNVDESCQCMSLAHVDIHWERAHAQGLARGKLEQILVSMKLAIASGLRSLSTLSVTLKNEPTDGEYCYCHESGIDAHYFAGVIMALPNTCTNLELDTGGSEIKHHGSFGGASSTAMSDSLCEALYAAIRQLKHLRLRMGTICPDFFYGPHNSLPLDLAPSACQTWAKLCGIGVPDFEELCSQSENIGMGTYFYGPTKDTWQWHEWNGLEETERRV